MGLGFVSAHALLQIQLKLINLINIDFWVKLKENKKKKKNFFYPVVSLNAVTCATTITVDDNNYLRLMGITG